MNLGQNLLVFIISSGTNLLFLFLHYMEILPIILFLWMHVFILSICVLLHFLLCKLHADFFLPYIVYNQYITLLEGKDKAIFMQINIYMYSKASKIYIFYDSRRKDFQINNNISGLNFGLIGALNVPGLYLFRRVFFTI